MKFLMLPIMLVVLLISATVVDAISFTVWNMFSNDPSPWTLPAFLINGILPFSLAIYAFWQLASKWKDK